MKAKSAVEKQPAPKPKTKPEQPEERDICDLLREFTALSIEVLEHPRTPVDFWNALTDAFEYLFDGTCVGTSTIERIELLTPKALEVLQLQKGGRKR